MPPSQELNLTTDSSLQGIDFVAETPKRVSAGYPNDEVESTVTDTDPDNQSLTTDAGLNYASIDEYWHRRRIDQVLATLAAENTLKFPLGQKSVQGTDGIKDRIKNLKLAGQPVLNKPTRSTDLSGGQSKTLKRDEAGLRALKIGESKPDTDEKPPGGVLPVALKKGLMTIGRPGSPDWWLKMMDHFDGKPSVNAMASDIMSRLKQPKDLLRLVEAWVGGKLRNPEGIALCGDVLVRAAPKLVDANTAALFQQSNGLILPVNLVIDGRQSQLPDHLRAVADLSLKDQPPEVVDTVIAGTPAENSPHRFIGLSELGLLMPQGIQEMRNIYEDYVGKRIDHNEALERFFNHLRTCNIIPAQVPEFMKRLNMIRSSQRYKTYSAESRDSSAGLGVLIRLLEDTAHIVSGSVYDKMRDGSRNQKNAAGQYADSIEAAMALDAVFKNKPTIYPSRNIHGKPDYARPGTPDFGRGYWDAQRLELLTGHKGGIKALLDETEMYDLIVFMEGIDLTHSERIRDALRKVTDRSSVTARLGPQAKLPIVDITPWGRYAEAELQRFPPKDMLSSGGENDREGNPGRSVSISPIIEVAAGIRPPLNKIKTDVMQLMELRYNQKNKPELTVSQAAVTYAKLLKSAYDRQTALHIIESFQDISDNREITTHFAQQFIPTLIGRCMQTIRAGTYDERLAAEEQMRDILGKELSRFNTAINPDKQMLKRDVGPNKSALEKIVTSIPHSGGITQNKIGMQIALDYNLKTADVRVAVPPLSSQRARMVVEAVSKLVRAHLQRAFPNFNAQLYVARHHFHDEMVKDSPAAAGSQSKIDEAKRKAGAAQATERVAESLGADTLTATPDVLDVIDRLMRSVGGNHNIEPVFNYLFERPEKAFPQKKIEINFTCTG